MEQAFLKFLSTQNQSHAGIDLGIGDDAAMLSWLADQKLVVCSDLIADETDFLIEETTPEQIGRKALAINLSDIAAMGCQPVGALLTLLLPQAEQSLALAEGIFTGASSLGKQFGCPIIGGDTNTWPGKLAISVTALGRCHFERPLLREGAQPGDSILVTGNLGGSILGHHLDFTPRLAEAQLLMQTGLPTAGMDISDGVSMDLPKLCERSQVGAEVDCSQVPISNAAIQMSRSSGKPAWWHALNDGEDFELLLTVPGDQTDQLIRTWQHPTPLTRIGTILAEPEVILVDDHGQRKPLAPEGYSHS